MHVAFAVNAAALKDIALWERHRIQFTRDMMLRGQVEPPPNIAFAGWQDRLKRIEAGAAILAVLAEHELAVRALDRRLSRPLLCGAPSMWDPPALTSPSP